MGWKMEETRGVGARAVVRRQSGVLKPPAHYNTMQVS